MFLLMNTWKDASKIKCGTETSLKKKKNHVTQLWLMLSEKMIE